MVYLGISAGFSLVSVATKPCHSVPILPSIFDPLVLAFSNFDIEEDKPELTAEQSDATVLQKSAGEMSANATVSGGASFANATMVAVTADQGNATRCGDTADAACALCAPDGAKCGCSSPAGFATPGATAAKNTSACDDACMAQAYCTFATFIIGCYDWCCGGVHFAANLVSAFGDLSKEMEHFSGVQKISLHGAYNISAPSGTHEIGHLTDDVTRFLLDFRASRSPHELGPDRWLQNGHPHTS